MAGINEFIRTYKPLAEEVGAKLGVASHALLGQWGLETGWGKSVIPGTNNLGNIKDFSGSGPKAKDNQTGSTDSYRSYGDASGFGKDFARLISKRYADAIGTGSDVGAYAKALKSGGYAEDPGYVGKLKSAAEMALTALSGSGSARASELAKAKLMTADDIFGPAKATAKAPAQPQQGQALMSADDIFGAPKQAAAPAPQDALSGMDGQTGGDNPPLQPVPKGGFQIGQTGGLAGINIPGWLDRGLGLVRAGSVGAADPTIGILQTLANATGVGKNAINSAIAQKSAEVDAMPGGGVARFVGNVASPANLTLARVIPGGGAGGSIFRKVGEGAAAGAVGGLASPVDSTAAQADFAATKGAQIGAGAIGGAVLGPIISSVANKFATKVRGKTIAPDEVQFQIEAELRSNGIDPAQIGQGVMADLRNKAMDTMKASGKMRTPTEALRARDFEALGIDPTRAQITRNPAEYAKERNLRAVPGAGDALTERLHGQELKLSDLVGALGSKDALPRYDAGRKVAESLSAVDKAEFANVSDLYNKARGSAGRYAELDPQTFATNVNNALDEAMLGRVLPADARDIINDISKGKVPFNINTVEQIKTVIGDMQSGASVTKAQRKALGMIRQQLDDAVINPNVPPTYNGAATGDFNEAVKQTAESFSAARGAARARFQKHDIPGYREAAEGSMSPDDWVKRFVFNGKTDDIKALSKVLPPDAHTAVRNQLASQLDEAAFGMNQVGDKPFSPERFNRTLKNIGDEKLSAFFSAEEIEKMHTIGRVGKYIDQVPASSPVNHSNTAGALLGNLFNSIPGGGMAMTALKGVVSPVRNAMAAKQALNPGQTMIGAEMTPEIANRLSMLGRVLPYAGGTALGSLIGK